MTQPTKRRHTTNVFSGLFWETCWTMALTCWLGVSAKNKQNTEGFPGVGWWRFEVISDGLSLGSGFRDFLFSALGKMDPIWQAYIFFKRIETTNLCCVELLVGVVLYQLKFHIGGGLDSCFLIISNYSPNMSWLMNRLNRYQEREICIKTVFCCWNFQRELFN